MWGRALALENRMDDATALLEGHEQEIDAIRAEIDALIDKQEDFENRSRHCNLRIRGLPEAVADLTGSITALFQELAPDIRYPIDRRENGPNS